MPASLFKPKQNAAEALSSIAVHLIDKARDQEPGILADKDIEALHRYRVSLRKLRSLLSSTKGIFERVPINTLKTNLSSLARQTNRLRDFDTLLANQDELLNALPPSLHEGFPPIFTLLRKERQKELRRIQRKLRSKTHIATIERIRSTFSLKQIPHGPKAKIPIREVATKRIQKRSQLISGRFKSLSPNAPDSDFHRIRIASKKLRYHTELFSPILPTKKFRQLRKQLKTTQETLGAFNDCCVHATLLESVLTNSPDLPPQTAATLGALIADLHTRKSALREFVSSNPIQLDS